MLAPDTLVADQEYLATFAAGTADAVVEGVASIIKQNGAQVKYMAASTAHAWQGISFKFLATHGPAQRQLLQHLADTPEVTSIEPNQVLSVKPVAGVTTAAAAPVELYEDAGASVAAVQQRVPSWGLDRIDGVMDNSYHYTSHGAGVCVYIVDSGVKKGHREFGDRRLIGAFIRYATDAFGQTDDDRNKHGTHVAGTVAGSTYGVAKAATVIPVRVLDNSGSGSTESLVAGLNYVISDSREQCKKKVVNLSLGLTTRVDSIDRAVQAANRAGILVVVAAGNDGVDACNASPAASPVALTVGATGKPTGTGRSMRETRATFSNYGSCVDIFAPGVDIVSASLEGWFGTTLSGTSMAAPTCQGWPPGCGAAAPAAQPGSAPTCWSSRASQIQSTSVAAVPISLPGCRPALEHGSSACK
ncbi:peptidase S8/S53 domain-containing protein [Scenedesmus sp. NREL 46B-D3]|nr:peptidase S8/S53 domain-containing protein [Scenedesmus sp. NREL 46B-D3]